MAEEMQRILSTGQGQEIVELRDELRCIIWDPEWQPEESRLHVPGVRDPSEIGLKYVALQLTRGLKFEEFQSREAAIADCILQTYSWIFDPPFQVTTPDGENTWSSFPDWLERSSDPIYWITGKPGSGKSTMMKYILENPALKTHLRHWAGDTPLLIARSYAWNAGATLQKSFGGLKRTLLYQILNQQPDLLPELMPRRWAYYSLLLQGISQTPPWLDWEIDESFKFLLSMGGDKVRLVLFVDGLDEFDVPPKEVVDLHESTAASKCIKACVASRPWVEFDDAYRDMPQCHMHLLTARDMRTFVAERFRGCRAFTTLRNIYPHEATRLLEELTGKSNGVFVWLRVVVDSLVESATEGCGIVELQAVLDSLLTDLTLLYDAIWSRIPSDSQRRGVILLQLVEAAF
ncbi:hypothetical protein B0H67DRAFT_682675 [Lasiosphaeris hirsuta]|uniref:Nephrocystin 3-like N-terminal domain-containing protein n=1 Tax=Lasiosphaeris hirsuta TaxID=260670 RepID=A0AA40E0V9_9PEZI|nr:hypothetical protein B0H67DRAFT_682675 [Lasiosphaeris hirsuta]